MNVSRFCVFSLYPIWPMIEQIGKQREEQKRKFQSSRLWRGENSTHIIGIAGEVIAATVLHQQIDIELNIRGDNGSDLWGNIDVKTSSYWPPILKHPVNSKHWPDYFCLVYFNEKKQHGCFIGMVTKDALKNGTIQQFGEGKPLNYTLTMEEVDRLNVAKEPSRWKKQI